MQDLTKITTIKKILIQNRAAARKSFGQNFLISKKALKEIIEAANLKKTDVVLEVGPGLGVLTQELNKKVKKLIAVEADNKFAEILKANFQNLPNVEIIKENILKTNPKALGLRARGYKIVANIPYQITSHFLRRYLETPLAPELLVLMIQKEVAQRILAKPPHMNMLAVLVQYYSTPKLISYIKRGSFVPPPKVDSAIIKLKLKNQNEKLSQKILELASAGFNQPRKKLSNNLSLELLEKAGIDPSRRAETLTIEEWKKLAS